LCTGGHLAYLGALSGDKNKAAAATASGDAGKEPRSKPPSSLFCIGIAHALRKIKATQA